MKIEELSPLLPASFFRFRFDLAHGKKPKLLPDLSELLDEETFTDVSASWADEGLYFLFDVKAPVEKCLFPHFTKGDSIELFIDTRNLKSAKALTRFCHHFVFFPEPPQKIAAQEITRLRAEESRPLADPELFNVSTQIKRSSYKMSLHIPTAALHGYNPEEVASLGFTYRINRFEENPQHFALSSYEYSLEKDPSLWASLVLKR